MKRLFAYLAGTVLLGTSGTAFAQIYAGEETIRGEIPQPTAIIQLSRSEPEFESVTIDKVSKDYGESAFALISDLIAPAAEEVEPRPMDNLKEMLSRERLPSR